MSRAYHFGKWLVEPELDRLSRDSTQRHVEPLAMDVLVYLLEHHDRVVSADEVLEQVWPDRHSEPGMVKKRVAQLRRVLADNPKRPRYIETIPKRGYRTVAPVRVVELSTPRVAGTARDSSPVPQLDLSISIEPLDVVGSESTVAVVAALVAEHVTDLLTKYPEVRVVSISRQHAGAHSPTAYRLAGSVELLAHELHVAVRLVRCSDGASVWSEVYRLGSPPSATDISRLVTTVARFLRVRLGLEAQFNVIRQHSGSQAAELVSEGLRQWHDFHQGSGTPDARMIESTGVGAVAMGDALPEGYALVAASKVWALYHGELSAAEASRQAHDAIAQGLAIDPRNARLLRVRCIVETRMDRNFDAAEASVREAMQVDPLNPDMRLCHMWLGRIALHRNDLVSALEHYRRAVRLFDGDARINMEYADVLRFAGYYRESCRVAQSVLDLTSAGMVRLAAMQGLINLYMSEAKVDEARQVIERIPESDKIERPGLYAILLAYSGLRAQARRVWQTFEESGAWVTARQGFHYNFALGNYDDTFDWLHRAIEQRSEHLLEYLGFDRQFAVLRGDPRWAGVMTHLDAVTIASRAARSGRL